ncbi:MAG: hypothetical protein ACTSQ0_06295 [Candidatus Heimdallarchaeota archaeon]
MPTIFGIPSADMINYLFYFELAFAISYILVGFALAKTPTFLHILLVILFAGGITTGFIFLNNIVVVLIICSVLYCLWIFITIISSYSFSKNLLGSRVTGSILFMGKKEGGSALFSGLLTPLIIACIGLNGYLLYQGIDLASWLYISTSVVGILMGGLLLVVIWRLARKDDVYYTILPFFYLMTNTHAIQLVIRLVKGDTNYIAWVSLLISAFFLLNSISKYYRKVQKLDADFLPIETSEEIIDVTTSDEEGQKETQEEMKEEFYISDVFKFISDRGVIMMILGFALAFHSMVLQIGFNKENINQILLFKEVGVVQIGHSITMVFAAIVVIFSIILYSSSNKFKNYTSPQIYRLNFLPPYEDVEKFVVDAKAGRINWKMFAREASVTLAKKGLSASADIGVSVKEQSIELAKKGVDVVKTKASSVIEKWRNKISGTIEEESEEIIIEEADDDF